MISFVTWLWLSSCFGDTPSHPPPRVKCAFESASFGPPRPKADRRMAGSTIVLDHFVAPQLGLEERTLVLENVGVDLDGDVYQAEVGEFELIARRAEGDRVSLRLFRTTGGEDEQRHFACWFGPTND